MHWLMWITPRVLPAKWVRRAETAGRQSPAHFGPRSRQQPRLSVYCCGRQVAYLPWEVRRQMYVSDPMRNALHTCCIERKIGPAPSKLRSKRYTTLSLKVRRDLETDFACTFLAARKIKKNPRQHRCWGGRSTITPITAETLQREPHCPTIACGSTDHAVVLVPRVTESLRRDGGMVANQRNECWGAESVGERLVCSTLNRPQGHLRKGFIYWNKVT